MFCPFAKLLFCLCSTNPSVDFLTDSYWHMSAILEESELSDVDVFE
jgi:hypothetical protein